MNKTFEYFICSASRRSVQGIDKIIPAQNLQKHKILAPDVCVNTYCKCMYDLEISRRLLTKSTRLTICSSFNCLDCFENLKVKMFGLTILAEKYFKKSLKDTVLCFHGQTKQFLNSWGTVNGAIAVCTY